MHRPLDNRHLVAYFSCSCSDGENDSRKRLLCEKSKQRTIGMILWECSRDFLPTVGGLDNDKRYNVILRQMTCSLWNRRRINNQCNSLPAGPKHVGIIVQEIGTCHQLGSFRVAEQTCFVRLWFVFFLLCTNDFTKLRCSEVRFKSVQSLPLLYVFQYFFLKTKSNNGQNTATRSRQMISFVAQNNRVKQVLGWRSNYKYQTIHYAVLLTSVRSIDFETV